MRRATTLAALVALMAGCGGSADLEALTLGPDGTVSGAAAAGGTRSGGGDPMAPGGIGASGTTDPPVDLDGDGVPDPPVDVDGDGVPDPPVDLDGDGDLDPPLPSVGPPQPPQDDGRPGCNPLPEPGGFDWLDPMMSPSLDIPIFGNDGGWRDYDDDTRGSLTIKRDYPGEACPERQLVRVLAEGQFTDWGTTVTLVLNQVFSSREPVSLSAYKKISFAAWAARPTKVTMELMDVPNEAVHGTCDETVQTCWIFRGKEFTFTNRWQRFTIDLSELKQPAWYDGFSFADFNEALAIQFRVPAGSSHEYWIDSLGVGPAKDAP